MTDPKDPKFVGVDPETPDGVVSTYRDNIKARAAKMRKERPKVGDLSEADALYKPGQDQPMTIGQVTEAADHMRSGGGEPKPALSNETIAGLRQLHEASAKIREQQKMEEPKPNMPAKPAVDREDEEQTPTDAKKSMAADALAGLDDLEFERLMSGIQHDVINNSEQRAAIDKLVTPFDLGKCLASNNWEQRVPVIPEKLEVTFRLVSPYENQMMRLMLFGWVERDPRLDGVAGDIYSLMMVVASIVQIGTNRLPNHLVKPDGPEGPPAKFNEAIFASKYEMISRYPAPFIHMLGVHSAWTDQRAREAMRVTNLKSG